MKHETSNSMSPRFLVELDQIRARIIVTDPDSIVETQNEDGTTAYEYNQYETIKPFRAGILEDVEKNFSAWYDMVKLEDAERTAKIFRMRRDELLRRSDSQLAIDRIGLEVPTGTTFSSWLVFLKQFGEMLTGEWAAYRKKLRDLTQNPAWPYIGENDWPVPPSEV